jgi:hypothetical protein
VPLGLPKTTGYSMPPGQPGWHNISFYLSQKG